MNSYFLFIVFLTSILFVNRIRGYAGTYLGEECKYDTDCQQVDPNSHCSLYNDRLICLCTNNYHIDVVNSTMKCASNEFYEEEKEGLTAAPIILCFLVCVVVEAFCLIAFRYWKKHRRSSVTRHGALHMQTITLSEFTRYPHSRSDPVVSFMITPEMESEIRGAHLSSPPPYSQTVILGTSISSQREDPPPPYAEAVKQSMSSCKLSLEEHTHRKMSC